MKQEEIQKKLLLFNRKGARMKITPNGCTHFFNALLDGSLTAVRVEGGTWWLSWRDTWFVNGSTPGHLIKVVKTEVIEKTDDEHEGEQWIEVVLTDYEGYTYMIEALIPGFDRDDYEAWKEWDSYRNKNRERMKEVDKAIIEAHTHHAATWRR
jgi:hypothetical protein